MKEVFEVPESKDMLLEGDYNDGMRIRGVRAVAFHSEHKMSCDKLSPPPHYGAHTRHILKDWLDFEDNDIEQLISKGVVYARKKQQ